MAKQKTKQPRKNPRTCLTFDQVMFHRVLGFSERYSIPVSRIVHYGLVLLMDGGELEAIKRISNQDVK